MLNIYLYKCSYTVHTALSAYACCGSPKGLQLCAKNMWSFGLLHDQDSQAATSIDYMHLEYPNNNILLSENAFITSAAFAFSAL